MAETERVLTPVEKLHVAISEFIHETTEGDVYLSNWFLGTTYVRAYTGELDEGEHIVDGMVYSRRYSTSDGDPYAVLGLIETCSQDYREAMTGIIPDDEE